MTNIEMAGRWLALAATPVFAGMALVTQISGTPDVLCSAMPAGAPPGGMVAMYILMSVFHAQPWLKIIGSLRRDMVSGNLSEPEHHRGSSSA
jgi:hypothetical protein